MTEETRLALQMVRRYTENWSRVIRLREERLGKPAPGHETVAYVTKDMVFTLKSALDVALASEKPRVLAPACTHCGSARTVFKDNDIAKQWRCLDCKVVYGPMPQDLG